MRSFNKAVEELLNEYLSDYTIEDLFDEFDLELSDVFMVLFNAGMISESQIISVFDLDEDE